MKDESIVRLTNQLHEMELTSVMVTSMESTNSPGGPNAPVRSAAGKITSNGLSFDSDKFEFREFVDVGSQTGSSTGLDGSSSFETLRDTVDAYEMQNKFLNKEVLELNQLRQQAADREQKFYM